MNDNFIYIFHSKTINKRFTITKKKPFVNLHERQLYLYILQKKYFSLLLHAVQEAQFTNKNKVFVSHVNATRTHP